MRLTGGNSGEVLEAAATALQALCRKARLEIPGFVEKLLPQVVELVSGPESGTQCQPFLNMLQPAQALFQAPSAGRGACHSEALNRRALAACVFWGMSVPNEA